MKWMFGTMSETKTNSEKMTERTRLFTSICLIMLIEYTVLDFEELVKMTGLSFQELRNVLQNLSNIKVVKVIPNYKLIPRVELLDLKEAQIFLKKLSHLE